MKNIQKNGITEIERARIIKRTLGVKVAAFYLKKRGWSLDAALFILAKSDGVKAEPIKTVRNEWAAFVHEFAVELSMYPIIAGLLIAINYHWKG